MSFCNLTTVFALIALNSISLYGQELDARVVPHSRTNPNGVLLYAKNKVESAEIYSTLDNGKLQGYNPLVIGFAATPDNLDEVSRELSWQHDNAWAFYYMGQRIASGRSAPTTDELQNAFTSANVPNRAVVLRNFMAKNPNNLNARIELMNLLHLSANRKTLRALNIIIREGPQSGRGSIIAPEVIEELPPEDDLNIWGDLAGLLTAAFATDDWLPVVPRCLGFPWSGNMSPHSPAMKAIYKRNLPKVENALKNRQTDDRLWETWHVMAQATGRRIMDFYPQFVDLPSTGWFSSGWPTSGVKAWMTEEARSLNDWQKVIELMWPQWQGLGIQTKLKDFSSVGRMPETNNPNALLSERDRLWKRFISPLLEACLNAKDFDKANEIYFNISLRPALEHEVKLAIEMARSHKYEFPALPGDYKVPEVLEIQAVSFIGDPVNDNKRQLLIKYNKLKDLRYDGGGDLHLLIVDPASELESETSKPKTSYNARLLNHIKSILSQDKFPEYNIIPHIMNPNHVLAVELIEKEGFSSNRFVWGILDNSLTEDGNIKYHHGGQSLPTSGNIMELLYSMRIKTSLENCRDFSKTNPDSITGRIIFLAELGRIGNERTANAIINVDNFLEESADQEIWGEYVNIANSLISHNPFDIDNFEITICFRLPFIKNSRQLQSFAMSHIGTIENALQAMPHNSQLWRLWGMFSPYAPNRSLLPFLASLTPVPGLDNIPPVSFYPEIIKNYKSLEAWAQIVSLVEPVWGQYQKMAYAAADVGEDIKHMLSKSVWEQYIAPLCEAYQKIGQDYKAEKIRSDWKKAEGWSQ